MSAAKENPCRKFQANFFNKSKCQNCFKPRELHLLTDQDLTQAKPIYGGWLCLAPEGTDFDNPMQRSRKWQRRFFVLYEHGCLRFALDESPSTLPQGTVNMNLCTDVIDAEPKTGQKNSLCIITPDQEYFIRGENKEIINGWSEQLVVYPRTNKQNQKKKRKVEPTTYQEPGPAKVAVTGSGIPEAEKVPDSSSIIWQEELNQREAEGAAVWAAADLPPGSPLPLAGDCASVAQGSDAGSVNGDEVDRGSLVLHGSAPQPPSDLLSPTGSCSSLGGVPRCLSPAPSDPFPSGSSLLSNGSHISGSVSSLDSDASGSTVTSNDSHPANQRGSHSYSHHDTPRSRRLEAEARKAEKRGRYKSPERQEREAVLSPERSRSGVIEKLEALELENPEKMEVEESGRSGARQGRSEHRRFHREEQRHDVGQGLDFPSTLPPLRRAKSLDRRTTESVMTPDLLNFKKGWMVKLDEQGQWKKYWFVLTDHSLRYYKDSIAEEASDLDGEIDLSTCCNVTEYQAQRNYGFQIHTQEGVHTLSAMTAGIRRNWIQAVMKNVRPSTAPDVASSTEDHGSFSPLEGLVRPDVTQDSPSSEASSVERESAPGVTKSRARERRREGRSKTFDWAEFRPIAQALAQQRAESLQADLGELERSRRREERRKRYESVSSTSTEQTSIKEGGRTDYEIGEGVGQTDSSSPMSLERQQRVEEVIEQHWQQVEKTPIREERRVPLPTTVQSRETAELEQLLENYKQGIEDLKAQLESCHQQLLDSNKHKQELEHQLRTALEREQDIRTGYISPLEHPLGLEADVTPQTKRPELVSSQAQSLTKKYQETKELLKLQELKKRNMQAQLGLSLSHLPTKEPYFSESLKPPILEGPSPEPVQKTVSFLLQDSKEAIQELEDFITGNPLTLKELAKLLRSHSCNQVTTEKHQLQKLLETWKYQQEIENETLKKSLARAGESIREYEARLLTMEDLVLKVQKQSFESLKSPYGPLSEIEKHSDTNDMTIGMLSQRVELLTSENGALKQRCQEIVNQLTEADREIDRLKAELINQQGGKQHHLVMEELKRLKAELAENQANAIDREYYERELNEKSLRLHEALVTLEELGNTLKDTEKKLQLKEATLKGLGFRGDYEDEELHPEKEQLKEVLEASQAKLFETEANLQATEQRYLELEARNSELITLNQESEKVSREKLREAENEIRMLREKLEMTTGEPIDSLDKHIELHDMVAMHRKELREVKDIYEQEAEKLRQEIVKASETLRLRSEENVKEIDSLTNCMENLKKKHEMEKKILMEKFDREMEELRSMMSPANPDKSLTDVDKLLHQASTPTSTLKERIQELATCERGFAAMEESHQKVIDELQRKHQRELENLQEEKERLLAEETAATIAAIEAMKNAHRTELEKELDRARKANSNTENADIEEIRRQHEEELCSFQREIEVLSEQYSQKCLENAHLAQALEAERQALRQCQRENQELNAHNQELNNRLAAEITKMRSMTSEDGVGDTNTTIQGKELYELEVMLRVKESEVQYLKQEINSLKDELQAAQRDKKYATDKYKDIYTELSIVKAKAERDLGRLRDQLQLAHEALGEPSLEEVERGGYDIMKSKSNPDILKMAAAAAKRSERTMRSKVGFLLSGQPKNLHRFKLQHFLFSSPSVTVVMEQPPGSLDDLQPQDLSTSGVPTVIDLTRTGEECVLDATSLDALRMVTSPGWYPNSGTSSPALPLLSETGSSDITLQAGDRIQPDNAFSHTTVTLSYVSRSRVFSAPDSLSRHSPLYSVPKLTLHPPCDSDKGLGETGYALNQRYLEQVDGPVDLATQTEPFQSSSQAQVGPENDGGACPREVNGGVISLDGDVDKHVQGQEELNISLENSKSLENGQDDSWSRSGVCAESSPETFAPAAGEDEDKGGSEVLFVMSKKRDPAVFQDGMGARDLCSLSREYISPLEDPVSPSATSQDDVEDVFVLPQASSSPSGDNSYQETNDEVAWDDLSAESPVQPGTDISHSPTRLDTRDERKRPVHRRKATLQPLIDLTDDICESEVLENKPKTVIPHMNGNAKPLQRTLKEKKLPVRTGRGTRLEAIVMNINSSRYKVSGCIRANKKKNASQSTASGAKSAGHKRNDRGKRSSRAKASFSAKTTKQKAVSPMKRGKTNNNIKTDTCNDSTSDCEINNSEKSHSSTPPKIPPLAAHKNSKKEPESPSHPNSSVESQVRFSPPLPPSTSPKKSQGKAKGKVTGSRTSPNSKTKGARTPKTRRRKHKPSQSSSMFTPKEPEIKLKYVNYKEEKRDLRLDSFSPFIRVERRQSTPSLCTVINYPEEVRTQRKKGQQQQQQQLHPGGFISANVPSTSCLQIGRASTHSQHQRSLICCLCGQSANAMDLGDLHGPYYPEGYQPSTKTPASMSGLKGDEDDSSDSDSSSCNIRGRGRKCAIPLTSRPLRPGAQLKDKGLLESRCWTCDSTGSPAAKRARSDPTSADVEDWYSPPVLPLEPCEYWLHEDCGIWSAGVFLVKGKVYGLEEAVKVAQETMCSACHNPGATLGCFFKGCPNKYHYRCALESADCVLIEENFSMKCKKHKVSRNNRTLKKWP
ncbi:hypothetical protein L3Q82_010484 [Scortum barcoo]|uniref:Uncharacterized protein n=1 Tax=Scortum barcoo TaxID=214431 RepID=A0ACB8WCS7_9TELE|nr:hypothetical protein L3Q82_010484 [Scortum barcoo]